MAAAKWRWYERNSLPWNRLAIHREMAKREAFARWPLHGNVLEALRDGRLEIGAHALFEPNVWITAPGDARVRIGAGTFLNMGVMIAAQELVEIGDHCMLANGCFVTDAIAPLRRSRRSRSPGRASRARARPASATTAGSARNVVVTSGVTIGERCVDRRQQRRHQRRRAIRSSPVRRRCAQGRVRKHAAPPPTIDSAPDARSAARAAPPAPRRRSSSRARGRGSGRERTSSA